MTDLGEIRVKLTGDPSGFSAATSFARDALVEMSDEIAKAVGKLAQLGVEAVEASVKLAGDFEFALVSAGAKANATSDELAMMGDAAMQAGLDSAFSAKKAADGMGNLAQAGFSVQEQVDALVDTLDLASAGEVEIAEAAKIAANALNAFRLEADEAGRVSDVLVKAANNADTSVSDLGKALGNAGGIAGQMGQSIEGTVAVLGQMQNVGITAAEAGTAVRSALSKLADESGKTTKHLESLGVETGNADGSLRELVDILGDMDTVGADASDFVEAFGEEVGPKLMTALSAGRDGLWEFSRALNEAGGEAKRVADEKLDTFNGKIQIMQGSIETLAIKFGQALTPALGVLADELMNVTNELSSSDEGAAQLEKSTTQLVEGLADLLSTAGPAIEAVALLGAAFIELLKALKILSLTLQIIAAGFAGIKAQAEGNERGVQAMRTQIFKLAAEGRQLDLGESFGQATEISEKLAEVAQKASQRLRELNGQTAEGADAVAEMNDKFRNAPEGLWSRESYDALVKATDQIDETVETTDELANTTRRAKKDVEDLATAYEVMGDNVEMAFDDALRRVQELERQDEELKDLLGGLGPESQDFEEAEAYFAAIEEAEKKRKEAQVAATMDLDQERREFRDYVAGGLLDFARSIADVLGGGAAEIFGLGSAVGEGAVAGSQFGPQGAAVGAALGAGQGLFELAAGTDAFKQGLARANEKFHELGLPFDSLSGAMDAAIRSFWPVVELFLALTEALKPIIDSMGGLNMDAAAESVFNATKTFLIAALQVADILTEISTFFLEMFAKVVRFVSDVAAELNHYADLLVPDGAVHALDDMADKAESTAHASESLNQGIEDARESIEHMTYEGSKLPPVLEEQREGYEEALAALTNVPEIFRLNLRRAQSTGATPAGSLDQSAPGAGTSYLGDIYIMANSPEKFEEAMERKRFIRTGDSHSDPYQRAFQEGSI